MHGLVIIHLLSVMSTACHRGLCTAICATQDVCFVPFRLKDIPIEEIYEFPEQAKIVKSSAVGQEKDSEQQTERVCFWFQERNVQ